MLGAYKCKVVAAAENTYIYIYIDPNTLRAPPPRQMSMKATKLINESGAKEQPRPFCGVRTRRAFPSMLGYDLVHVGERFTRMEY